MPSSSTSTPASTPPSETKFSSRYYRVRGFSELIAAPLAAEDCVVQSMPDVSPTRWHLAHTTWFFETFLLKPRAGYQVFDPGFDHLFNSYYNTVGEQFPRAQRGLLSRPTVDQVLGYRRHVDDAVMQLLASKSPTPEQRHVLEIGLQHEQQHQELMLTDIKHVLSCNPLFPEYADSAMPLCQPTVPMGMVEFEEGLRRIGHASDEFAYDNESPQHQVYLPAFQMGDRLVTAGEYLDFINDGGYQHPGPWLSMGWQTVKDEGWTAPLYWHKRDGQWFHFTLSGLHPIDPAAPLCHVSYFEADAYARWTGARLPTEAEWETASQCVLLEGSFADPLIESGVTVHPQGPAENESRSSTNLSQMFGEVWQWTQSSYAAYPGYRVPDGALGEYNGKFMCGQYVLRGGSCATPNGHVRRTYRNFFPPSARWQFSGIRLAKDQSE